MVIAGSDQLKAPITLNTNAARRIVVMSNVGWQQY